MTVHQDLARAEALRALGCVRAPFGGVVDGASAWPRTSILHGVRDALARGASTVAVVGGGGSGKSSLVGPLRIVLGSRFTVGVLPDAASNGGVQPILAAFSPDDVPPSRLEARRALTRLLRRRAREGRPCLLVIDDAHRTPEPVASELERVVRVGASDDAPLKAVLLGPRAELEKGFLGSLRRTEIEAGPLEPVEARAYIRHRLRAAGGPPDLFDDAAVRELAQRSGGAVRALNQLAAACLEAAAARGTSRIDAELVRSVSAAMGDGPPAPVVEPEDAAEKAWSKEEPDEFRFAMSSRPDPHRGAAPAPTPATSILAEPASEPVPAPDPRHVEAAGPYPAARSEGVAVPSGDRDAAPVRRGAVPEATDDPGKRGRGAGSLIAAAMLGLVIGAGLGTAFGPAGLAAFSEWRAGAWEPGSRSSARRGGDDAASSAGAVAVAWAPTPLEGAEAEARALYGRAVGLAATEPESAVVAYARAALRGHDRSARYLGQIYEIGDGVPPNPALARAWYAFAEDGTVAAARDVASSGASRTPLFSARGPDGTVELVWSGAGGGAGHRVEFARTPDAEAPLGSLDAAISAARATVPDDAAFWRVDGGDWTPIEAADP